MNRKNLIAVTAAATLLAAPLAQAQYAGPNAHPTLETVGMVLSDGHDDQSVRLQGRLIRQIDEETYRFSDGSGEIDVEIDDDDFPQVQVSETTRVELIGEIDSRRLRDPEIDVEQLRVITP